MRFLRKVLFCVRAYCIFVVAERRTREQQSNSESIELQNQAMYDRLQNVYSMLLEKATKLAMEDTKSDNDYYDILDTLYDMVVNKYER